METLLGIIIFTLGRIKEIVHSTQPEEITIKNTRDVIKQN
jgi:hypothetical protein